MVIVDPIEPNSIPVINPASEESIGNVSVGSKEDVDKAVQAARNAFQSFQKHWFQKELSY